MEVAEAGEDAVITQEEFGSIITIITSIFSGVMIAVFVGILIKDMMEEFAKETGVKILVL